MNPIPTPAPEGPLHWHDGLLLGYQPMDDVHHEFVSVVSALQNASDADLASCLDAVVDHAQRHFDDENRWMVETQFPARECHIDEHAAVLASLHEVQQLAAKGDTSHCRRLADELARWFPGHADYLDSALAHWMCKQRLGGKPVVIRRDLASSRPPATTP
ncbi:bacteriohemerythrin [Tepidicella baoligensis]|uniref:bacteriohemerythrin n=1 Tax=Tepidicella baoligensis TaxID=2707016 RepID=UPI0015DB6A21|nr:hemerythrin domain-containing protein [Tepidicella baoligensis]